MEEKYIAIGKILGPFKLDGRVKVSLYSGIPDRLNNVHVVYMEDESGFIGLIIEAVEETVKGPIVSFKGVTNRVEAERLTGREIFVNYSERINPPEDAYYIDEVIGCSVYHINGDYLGKVAEVIIGAGNDVWVVTDENGKEFLIPVVDEFVREMELENQKIVISPIEGMLPEDEDNHNHTIS